MRVILLARHTDMRGGNRDYGIPDYSFRSLGVFIEYNIRNGMKCYYGGRQDWWSLDDMHVELRVKQQLC